MGTYRRTDGNHSGTYARPAGVLVEPGMGGTDEPGAFVVWSADDGYDTQEDFFALLNTKGIDGTLFLSSDYVDKAGTSPTFGDTYITTAQVQAIVAAGHEVGTHGKNHEDFNAYLTANGAAALDALLGTAINAIESGFGVTVRTGSYPGGLSNVRVREIMARRHEFFRSSKGVVSRHAPDPFDVPSIDILALSEAQVKAYIDQAVTNRSVVVFLEHGTINGAELTKVGNCIDYATSLGVRQGTFYNAMSERTAWRSRRALIDQQGNAFHPAVRTQRIEVYSDKYNLADYWHGDVDETTGNPYFDASQDLTFEFRRKVEIQNTARFTKSGGPTIDVQPSASQSDSTQLVRARRSAAEASNAGADVFAVQQNGKVVLSGAEGGNFDFRDAAGTVVAQFTGALRTWKLAGTGGTMTIDSGTGGSNFDLKAFRFRFIDHSGNRKIALASALPTDASVNTGELVMWFDSTSGAAKVMFKAKDAGGTVRTGELALA